MYKRSNNIPNKVYKFVHTQDEWIKTNIKGKSFENDRLVIDKDGKITLKGSYGGGYAWDGCSPKFQWLDLLFGTPDGRLDYQTEKPITYYASMFHDAIYQYKKEAGMTISRAEADILFKIMLKKSNFIWASVYNVFVRMFGGAYGKWASDSTQNNITIEQCSWIKE